MATKKEQKRAEAAALAAAQDALAKQRRQFVETCASYGMPPEEIGLLLVPPIDATSVKRDYALELEMGPARANLETTAQLRALIKKGNAAAAIYWTKARMGWTEKGPEKKEPAPAEDLTETPATLQDEKKLAKILGFPSARSRPS